MAKQASDYAAAGTLANAGSSALKMFGGKIPSGGSLTSTDFGTAAGSWPMYN